MSVAGILQSATLRGQAWAVTLSRHLNMFLNAPALVWSKTKLYIDYAKEKCGATELTNVCSGTPNG